MGRALKVDYLNGSLDLVATDLLAGELLEEAEGLSIRGLTIERSSRTGEIVAFEALKFPEYYRQTLADLARNPIAVRYDVPAFGLRDASLAEVLQECYRRFVKQPAAQGRRRKPAEVVPA